MFPLAGVFEWSSSTVYIVSIFIGFSFGFFLERAGMGNASLVAMQFYFRDTQVLKMFFSILVTAMSGVIILGSVGLLDTSSIFIGPTFLWAQIAGAAIMGVGFAFSGYCPGISFPGVVTLKKDAFFYVGGIVLGIFIFGEIEPLIEPFYAGQYSGSMGVVTLDGLIGIRAGVIGFFVILMALGAFYGVEWLEKSGIKIYKTKD
jgi:uncharacterized protein